MLQSKCCSTGRWSAQRWAGRQGKRRHVGTLQRRGLDIASTHAPPATNGQDHIGAEVEPRGDAGAASGLQRAGLKKTTVNAAAYECVRVHPDGRVATVFLKRRDLLRLFTLDPRDLRRIDPHLQFTRSSPTMYVKDNVVLVQLAGVRLIITAQTALVLDPHCPASRQFLAEIIPKLQVAAGQRLMQEYAVRPGADGARRGGGGGGSGAMQGIPFELSVLEAALHISVAKMDNELERAQARVQACLERLPRDITPQNLDDLRRSKSALVELESKSDAHREMLEDIMDDEDELKEFNLSSRVLREERRRARERSRLERELERERESTASGEGGEARTARRRPAAAAQAKSERSGKVQRRRSGSEQGLRRAREEAIRSMSGGYAAWEKQMDALDRRLRADAADTAAGRAAAAGGAGAEELATRVQDEERRRASEGGGGAGFSGGAAAAERWGSSAERREAAGYATDADGEAAAAAAARGEAEAVRAEEALEREGMSNLDVDSFATDDADELADEEALSEWRQAESSGKLAEQAARSASFPADYSSAMLNRIEAYQTESGGSGSDEPEETEVMQELRELFEAEEEEQELQEVEDLLEFYLQRATAIQTEAERLLAGARDLEESIGLALSARRFEVQRLELRLSIGSFAAALGAVVAGIFGMNLRSTLEESVLGFWGTTVLICAGCVWVYCLILDFTRRRKILM